jgi:DNA replication and repair protein RecF
MHVDSVEVRGLRCLSAALLSIPAAGAWVVGPNGAGKTSMLEALCLLGFGRSFRGRVADGLVQQGQDALEVVARWTDGSGRSRVSGLRHRGDTWEGRLDGAAVGSLSELAAPFPVLCFHPESSRLVTGPAEERRRALDWLAFHVEPRFAVLSRRYARALRQRNALLRVSRPDDEFEPWERELGQTADAITAQRQAALSLWQPAVGRVWESLNGDVGAPDLQLRAGWRQGEVPLSDLLLLNRGRDRELGYTTIGPQRADLSLGRPFGVEGEQLSRGQAKLLALTLLLAQAEALRLWTGERSLMLLDDLQAELDAQRQAAVLAWVRASGYQTLVTGTRIEPDHVAACPGWAMFHVERGAVRQG